MRLFRKVSLMKVLSLILVFLIISGSCYAALSFYAAYRSIQEPDALPFGISWRWNVNTPSFIPEKDWKTVETYCSKYDVDPYLIAAIGWHETHWGRLGWGKEGYYLGVGCYSSTRANPAFKGLDKQLGWAVPRIAENIKNPVDAISLQWFAKNIWKPGDPEGWANSVFGIWEALRKKYTKEVPKPVLIPKEDVKVRDFLEAQGFKVGWNNVLKQVTANGVLLDIKDLVISKGVSYATPTNIETALVDAGLKTLLFTKFVPIREYLEKCGYKVGWSKVTHRVLANDRALDIHEIVNVKGHTYTAENEINSALSAAGLRPCAGIGETGRLAQYVQSMFAKILNPKFLSATIADMITANVDFWFSVLLKLLDGYYEKHKGEK